MFIREVADALAARSVPWCVAGGVAVNLHGVPRMTYDVDIVVDMNAASLAATREALEGLGLRCRLPLVLESLAGASGQELAARNLIAVTFTDSNNPLREVDVLVAPSIAPATLIARIDDLIALKNAAGRPQDVAHLERVRR